MGITNSNLKEDFKEYFGITEVIKDFEGGQKKVFIINNMR